MRTLKYIVCWTILIGVIGLSLNMVLGGHTITFVQKQNVQTLGTNFYIWKFDFWHWIENIQLAASNISELQLKLPTRQWDWMDNVFDGAALTNDLALMLDYLILVINVMLYPFRIGAYLCQNALAILGVNNDINDPRNGLAWLITFVETLIRYIQIPYI